MRWKLIVLTAGLVISHGCNPLLQGDFFTFPVREVEDVNPSDTLYPTVVSVSGVKDLVRFQVIDTVAVYYRAIHQESNILNAAGLVWGTDLGHFCPRGRGPDEMLATNMSFELFDGNAVMYDWMNCQYRELDVLRSVKEQVTRYARSVRFSNAQDKPMLHPHRVAGDRAILFDTASVMEADVLTHEPCFSLYDLNTGDWMRDYACFHQIPMKRSKRMKFSQKALLMLDACMDDDRERMAFVMNLFPQCCVLDIESGETFGVRIKGKQKFSPQKEPFTHFLGIASSGDRIYALYHGESALANPPVVPCELYVFDWSGNIVGRFPLDRPYYSPSIWENDLYFYYWEGEGLDGKACFCKLNLRTLGNAPRPDLRPGCRARSGRRAN